MLLFYSILFLTRAVLETAGQADDYCDRHYVGNLGAGVITSPNYPFNYRDVQRSCTLRIYLQRSQPRNDLRVCFTFHRFRLAHDDGCFGDSLEFHSQEDSQIYKYCGTGERANEDPNSKSNVFMDDFCWRVDAGYQAFEMTFRTDAAVNDTGFYATYTITPTWEQRRPTPVIDKATYDEQRQNKGLAPCESTSFTCFNRNCVSGDLRCNKADDCDDDSDEGYQHARCSGEQDLDACNFEEGNCFFSTSPPDATRWIHDNSSPGGPRFDHTIGENRAGYFMYTTYRQEKPGMEHRAILLYADVPYESSTDRCLSFWYYMTATVGTLSVYVNASGTVEPPRSWYRKDDHGMQWVQGEIFIPRESFPLRAVLFVGEKGNLLENNIAVDDISLLDGQCFGDDISCTFELSECAWYADDKSDLSWERMRGETPSIDTGPSADMSGNGYYMYMESSGHAHQAVARLVSRQVSHGHSGSKCLSFWYHMYGKYVESLSVILLYHNGMELTKWEANGDKGDEWHKAYLNLPKDTLNGPFQLVFEGVVGEQSASDIAVDDILLQDSYCQITVPTPSVPNGTTTTMFVPPPSCYDDQFQCDNGDCIPSQYHCDGRMDCADKSDEVDCEGSVMSLAAVIGASLVVGIFVVVLIICSIYCGRRYYNKRNRRNPRTQQGDYWMDAPAHDNPDEGIYETVGLENPGVQPIPPRLDRTYQGEPPPVYTVETPHTATNPTYNMAGHGALCGAGLPGGPRGEVNTSHPGPSPEERSRSTLTISLSYDNHEPPPPYQVAIIASPPAYSSENTGQQLAAGTAPPYSVINPTYSSVNNVPRETSVRYDNARQRVSIDVVDLSNGGGGRVNLNSGNVPAGVLALSRDSLHRSEPRGDLHPSAGSYDPHGRDRDSSNRPRPRNGPPPVPQRSWEAPPPQPQASETLTQEDHLGSEATDPTTSAENKTLDRSNVVPGETSSSKKKKKKRKRPKKSPSAVEEEDPSGGFAAPDAVPETTEETDA